MPDEVRDDLHRDFEDLRAELRAIYAHQTRTLLVAMFVTFGSYAVVQILIALYLS